MSAQTRSVRTVATLPARAAKPQVTWQVLLVEGDSPGIQLTALALAEDPRISECIWIDWTSGLADQWVGTRQRTRILDRPQPCNWDAQLKMLDRVAAYARAKVDATGKPIAVVVDSMTAVKREMLRWARTQANNVPKVRASLREYPGLHVELGSALWDEVDRRHTQFVQKAHAIPGVTVLLSHGAMRVTDGSDTALVLPDYKIDVHRAVTAGVHTHVRVDPQRRAYPTRVPPMWLDRVDPAAAVTLGDLVFGTFGLDPATAVHHTGL